MIIVQVIPSLRTPRHVAAFDYTVPEGMTVRVGAFVRIPFRTKTIVGIVSSISEGTELLRPLKPITDVIPSILFSSPTLQLLAALAERSGSSPATVLHAWIGTLPKRIPNDIPPSRQVTMLGKREVTLLTDRWHHPDGVIASARRAREDGKRVLILTPWAESASSLAKELDAIMLTGTLAAGARFKAWSGFVRGDQPLLVATRLGAWLAPEADVIILDEPENDDHKQDEMSPRYDARWIVERAHATGSAVLEIGLTPRLSSAPLATPGIACDLISVDIHPSDWSSVAGLQNRALNALEEARDD